MGRNAAIKGFDPAVGHTLDLFDEKEGHLSVILEILKSPWVARGSDLLAPEDAGIGKRRGEAVAVAWDEIRRVPAAFEWHARTYRVDEIAQLWAVERFWWDPRRRISHRCWRVIARGGTYDLAYDRIERRWMLLGVQD